MTKTPLISSLLCICLVLTLISCRHTYTLTASDANRINISPAAISYYNTAFEQIRSQSIKAGKINFEQLYSSGLDHMKNARTAADTYDAIRHVLAGLQDNHSFFQAPLGEGKSIITALSTKPGSFPFTTSIVEGQIGKIVLKSYNSIDEADQHAIADSLYRAIAYMSTQQLNGLIIDFRVMEGGSAPPFLCAFAPLINKDMLLGYKDNRGHKAQITRYKNGVYYKDGRKIFRLAYLTNYTTPALSQLPIAIITGRYTASAGEMILISFLGLPNVKLFGEPTYGVPTGKSNIFLADSAFISLTSSTTYDRLGHDYDGPVLPDQKLDLSATTDEELYALVKKWMATR